MEGAKHNLPDADAQEAAEEIKNLASQLTEEDLLLVLISGKKIKSKFVFILNTTKRAPLTRRGQKCLQVEARRCYPRPSRPSLCRRNWVLRVN